MHVMCKCVISTTQTACVFTIDSQTLAKDPSDVDSPGHWLICNLSISIMSPQQTRANKQPCIWYTDVYCVSWCLMMAEESEESEEFDDIWWYMTYDIC